MHSVPASNREWEYWGRIDPMFAVVTRRGRDRNGEKPWTRDTFLATGRSYINDVWRQWHAYGVAPGHCVEIGCGAGRMTRPLADHFARVTALDVSSDQISLAKEYIGEAAPRVNFILVSAPTIPLPDASVDAAYSCEVFQHFDSDLIFDRYLHEMTRVLVPGGTLCFHVPVVGLTARQSLRVGVRKQLLRVLRIFGRRRMMIYRAYRADRVMRVLAGLGLREIESRVFVAGDERAAFFFARK